MTCTPAAKRRVEHADLVKFSFLSRPAFAPDGNRIAYVVSRADADKNDYHCTIWLYDLLKGTDRRLTSTGSEKFFSWTSDGSGLVFASGRGAVPKDSTRFYMLPLDGGEAAELFTVPHKVSDIRDLGGGVYLLSVVYEPEIYNPEKADYSVFEQLPFMANGKGFIGQRRTALALYDTAAGELTRITPEHLDVESFKLSADGGRVLLVGTDYIDVKPIYNHVYELDLKTRRLVSLSDGLEFGFKAANYMADAVMVVGCDKKRVGVNQNVQFFLLRDGRLTCVTPDLDSSLHNCVGSDCRYNLSDELKFIPDGDGAVYCSTDGFVSFLHRVSLDGGIATMTKTLLSVDAFDYMKGQAAVVGFMGLHLQELYLVRDGQETRLTHHNDAICDELELSQPVHVLVDNREGWQLDGWYMKPVGYEEGKKYPAILHIHGGPKGVFGANFSHEMQCWAAKGYVVLYTNPRGSDGRAGGFDDIRGCYGVKDYHDLMVFTDWCLENLPFVDKERLGVTGGSYGGYMTNWIVTHTDRFKAAVAQRSISNWVSKFGSCDIGYYYVEDQHLGKPWTTIEQPWEDSPLKHAANAKTPLLLIQSNDDFRCERDQAFQMFTAMKLLGVECKICLFNGENHELSRSGRPRNRLARLREITDWFESHIK